ncbi:hypothetical protein [Streptomyces sp. NBC_01408]|uniref:hypothetical protein n=1 Tax=Streptomyces sp. NBC_01408 TaxID=2903855 RepID=UPI0022573FC8|nr:hypothetical protein [Streptomyces sp. NBC_01408]MCX4696685.1 hypothetical protein [Streptomyces sp. NBC_01408]
MGGSGPGPWEVAVRRLLRLLAAWALAVTVGVLWWWAVLRLVLAPADSGAVEGAVAVGGWGLGVLPVHCVPGPARRARRAAAGATRASTLPRSGEGSAPS